MKNLPQREKKKSNKKIYYLARLNILFFQVVGFFTYSTAGLDLIANKNSFETYKAITVFNWSLWLFIIILIIFQFFKINKISCWIFTICYGFNYDWIALIFKLEEWMSVFHWKNFCRQLIYFFFFNASY